MATAIAAMKGHLGNTDYYILSMKAQELVTKVKIPKEMKEWDDLSLEERYQRDINYNRVRTQIAPYLANEDNRFFGAIIVTALNSAETPLQFEPLSSITTKGLPALYATASNAMGFLTFTGGEVLVPLDGQHRLKAIEFAISARDERGRDIDGFEPCTALAQEDVTVIVIPEDPKDPKKARRIFTRVNKYARPTTTGQNIVTDDDDFVAVLTRDVVNEIIGTRLAKYTSNSLTVGDPQFTTLSVVYNCNHEIIARKFPEGKLEKHVLPDAATQSLYRDKVMDIWTDLKNDIDVFRDATADPEDSGDDDRREIRKSNLLGRPVTQECVVRAYLRLTAPSNRDINETLEMGGPAEMTGSEACRRLNQLPWNLTEESAKQWQNVLWSGGVDRGRMITKQRDLAEEMIAYWAGEPLSEHRRKLLLEKYRAEFHEDERASLRLPKPIDLG